MDRDSMKTKIELRDLKRQYNTHKINIDSAIHRVLSHGQFISGREIELLEQKLAEYVGVDYCITCANGTDAMLLVLMAWNIGPGDAVFVPDFTFVATAEVVALRGATPIFVDVDERTFNMDAVDLEKAIQEVLKQGELKPRVIIPVDLFGLPADYEAISKVAEKYNLLILEDAAQGFGGSITGRKACSYGKAATTSFFPAKPLGCYGDGGAIFTNNKKLAELLYSIRVHGKGENKYDNVRVGTNSRLDTLQAAILIEKLSFLDEEIQQVNEISQLYNKGLSSKITKPVVDYPFESSYAQYTIILESLEQRLQLINFLGSLGIPTTVFYPKALSDQTVFSRDKYLRKTTRSLYLADRVLSIPIHPYLFTDEVEFIIHSINDFLGD
jgi:UDP-2-acetamido-2-deoxy-ribo-hexuluronate aminotransferase